MVILERLIVTREMATKNQSPRKHQPLHQPSPTSNSTTPPHRTWILAHVQTLRDASYRLDSSLSSTNQAMMLEMQKSVLEIVSTLAPSTTTGKNRWEWG